MAEQQQLALNRVCPLPGESTHGAGFHFFSCTSYYVRWTLWAFEYKLRLLLPERRPLTPQGLRDGTQTPEYEYFPDPPPGGQLGRTRKDWDLSIPTVVTEHDEWRAGSRGNDPGLVATEIINTAFFPWEREQLLAWIKDGCPLTEDDEHYTDLVRAMDCWFAEQIMDGNTSPRLEKALRRVPIPERMRENLLGNFYNYRREAHVDPRASE